MSSVRGWRKLALITFVSLGCMIMRVPNLFAQWVMQKSGTEARFRGLSVVNGSVIWCSGTKGMVARTEDAGATWRLTPVAGASDLDLRDIHAFDNRHALALSIGDGAKSRIYKTTDGGATWKLLYQNQDPKGFLDAIAFWDETHGLAFGDPIGGRFLVLTTDDAGATWARVADTGMPAALPGEGAFAASGTCLVVDGNANAWFATGGAKVARVFRSVDRGRTWSAHETPVAAGKASAGIFSLAFRDATHGIAVGGDYRDPNQVERTSAWTSDGGVTWTLSQGRLGYRSGVVPVRGKAGPTLMAVGPNGSSLSTDEGKTWRAIGEQGFHAVGAADGVYWAVGDGGVIARFGE